jgi:lactoylglutathione lyase
MITKIRTITIFVQDQHAALRFYTEKLGFVARCDLSDWIEVAPSGAQTTFLLMPRFEGSNWERKQAEIYLSVDDTQATYDQLLRRGVMFVRGPKQSDNLAIFDDPDGNRFYLTSQPDQSPNPSPQAEPSASDRQISTIYASTGNTKTQGK